MVRVLPPARAPGLELLRRRRQCTRRRPSQERHRVPSIGPQLHWRSPTDQPPTQPQPRVSLNCATCTSATIPSAPSWRQASSSGRSVRASPRGGRRTRTPNSIAAIRRRRGRRGRGWGSSGARLCNTLKMSSFTFPLRPFAGGGREIKSVGLGGFTAMITLLIQHHQLHVSSVSVSFPTREPFFFLACNL